MKTYGIPENRILNSKDVQFKYEIMRLTKGKGVDIVLNSFKEESQVTASLECMAEEGRFVLIDKPQAISTMSASFLNNISCITVDVQGIVLNPALFEQFAEWLHSNSNNGMIKPIGAQIFSAEEVEESIKYMTTDKHFGNIVIKMRDEEKETEINNEFNSTKLMTVSTKTFFDPNKVFIISGGLGGSGLELVHWMVFLGARKLVLTSRYGVKSDYQKFVLKRFKSFGGKHKYFEINIVVSTEDTNSIEGAKKLISDSQWMGTIGGIFHLAFESDMTDLYTASKIIDTKSKMCQNLDQLSRNLKLNLDYFVVFSSQSSGRGIGGQLLYGYGNSVCDRICEERRRDGLHGLAIQWGPIGDVGIIADLEADVLFTFERQRINSLFDKMDKMLPSNYAIISSVVSIKYYACYYHSLINCFNEKLIKDKQKEASISKESKLMKAFWSVLGIDPKTTPDNVTLGEIGVDSVTSIYLQQNIIKCNGIKLSLAQIKNLTIGLFKEVEQGKLENLKNIPK